MDGTAGSVTNIQKELKSRKEINGLAQRPVRASGATATNAVE
jgi:hypothetical protein